MTGSNSDKLSNRYKISMEYLERAYSVIPSQAQTFSKNWTQYPKGAAPIFSVRADGGHVWDVDGNKFIDWPMALGPLLLGHNYSAVNNAIKNQLDNGIAFSLPTKGELELSERLVRWFPYAERVRFGKNGSDATSGSVRAARAYTNRDIILCCGYHGWQDWFIGTTSRSKGIPESVKNLTIPFPYNDIEFLERLLKKNKNNVAAIILEPMGIELPKNRFLEKVRDLADEHKAILIFDECWTGFRIHQQGAYGKFKVSPDLSCFGKALGNGVPISAIVGRASVLEMLDKAFFSFTFGGDMLGITAATAVLDTIESKPVLEHVENIGNELMIGCKKLISQYNLDDHIEIIGYPARHLISFKGSNDSALMKKSLFQQEALARGILSTCWHAPSFSHSENDIEFTLKAYNKVFSILIDAIKTDSVSKELLGTPVQPVFREP